jgi:hypothetical protein
MTNPMSDFTFAVFLTIVTGGVSLVWFFFDLRNLLRVRALDTTNPSIRDRRFGYSMGLVIATIGIAGSAKYWL